MNPEKRSEVIAFFWLVLSAIIFISLVSYTATDVSFEVSAANYPPHNFAGIFGAHVAWFLILLFGKAAYFLVPLFLLWSLLQWAGKKSQRAWLKVFTSVVFFGSACALFSLIASESDVSKFQSGGIIGYFVGYFLNNVFGHSGIFVAFSLFLLSVILASEMLLLQVAGGLFGRMKTIAAPVFSKSRLASDNPKSMSVQSTVIPKKTSEPTKPQIKLNTPAPMKAPEPVPAKPAIKLNIPKISMPKPEKPIEAKVEAKPKSSDSQPVMASELPNEDGGSYRIPGVDLLESPPAIDQTKLKGDLEATSKLLEDTLTDFGVEAKVVEVEQGPTITRYELQPAAGVKVQKITSLENDIARAMRATSVRIVAPIPGKDRVGIEVPNSSAATVYFREMIACPEFKTEGSKIAFALGKDTAGAPIVCNLADMPHLLIAGATNTGKSVCINTLITSMLYRSTPDELKLLLIDPKMVELHFYNDLPHLICPVVTDKSKAPGALAWLVAEMERRYKVLSKVGAKNILSFNEKVTNKSIDPKVLAITPENQDEPIVIRKMPYIVVVIDELADLMMSSANEVETAITRLAQLARAVGIHMVLATQRPSVDVITGVIKANFPARIAFQVASKVDSRTILDENGADKLLGRGDLLFMDPRKSRVIRAQGAWVQDKEIEKITTFIKNQRKPAYTENILQTEVKKMALGDFKKDEVYDEAKRVVLETGQASVSMVQRRLGLGYTRAARLIDMMEEEGVVGPYRGAKPREILVERPNASKQQAGNESLEA